VALGHGAIDNISAAIKSGDWKGAALGITGAVANVASNFVPGGGGIIGKGVVRGVVGKGLAKIESGAGAKLVSKAEGSVAKQGEKFFKDFGKREGAFGHETKQIGKFTEFKVSVPATKAKGTYYTTWSQTVNQNGRTVRLYHDTFNARTGDMLHRSWKVPGPYRHVWARPWK